jgi:tellurite resistance protein TerC
MIWFWIGFFVFVALLLVLDLGVLHREAKEPTLGNAAAWTAAWMALGLAFTVVVYLMYENNWMDVHLRGCPPNTPEGIAAAETYVSAYLLEQSLSVDNIFAIALVFEEFKVPVKYQHRVLFWGVLGAVVFRVVMLSGGAYVAARFDWIFYVFGAYLAYKGLELVRAKSGDDDEPKKPQWLVRLLRKFFPIVDGDHDGKFLVKQPATGRRALTTVAVCLIVVEFNDIMFSADSIPAVLSVSRETFIMVTSNIFAILGLRSLYFVLRAAMTRFKYLSVAVGVLLVVVGAKMLAHDYYEASHLVTLVTIASILGAGILASIVAGKREARASRRARPSISAPPPASPSP